MKHSKRWGASIVAITVIWALASVSSASAGGFLVDSFPATFNGKSTTTHSFSTNIAQVNCSESSFSTSTEWGTEVLQAAPSYSGCTLAGLKSQMTMKMNGCSFNFHVTGGEKNVFNGTVDVGPAGCGPITISGSSCTQTIPAQSGLSSAGYVDQGSGSGRYFDLEAQVGGISFTSSGAACGTYSGTSGFYTGTWKVAASNTAGEVGTRAAGADAIFPAGGEEGKPALRAARYPLLISGAQQAALKYTLGSSQDWVECSGESVTGPFASEQSEFGVAPVLSGCSVHSIFGNTSVKANMRGCGYRYTLTESPPPVYLPYYGTMSLMCPDEQGISFSGAGCTVNITPQVLGKATYKVQSGGEIPTTVAGEGISYSEQGFVCSTSGRSGSNGAFSNSLMLKGSG